MEKNELKDYPEMMKIYYDEQGNVLSFTPDIKKGVLYRKVGEGEDEFRKFLDNITTDNICNEYVHGFNDAIQVVKDRLATYELHRKEGK